MENLSDFWKSARERFTNPFAFAYIVAWFSCNWKVTVALFFTDEYPIQNQNVYDFISDELRGFGVWLWPIFWAIFYVVAIAFIRQLVDWLNVVSNKIGNDWIIRASKGGKVSIEKYMAEREKVLTMIKELESIYETETTKTTNFNNLQKTYNQVSERYGLVQKANSELQTNMTNEQRKAKNFEQMLSQTRSWDIIHGSWDVQLGEGHRMISYRVHITNQNVYIDKNKTETIIENLFYNRYTQELFFYRFDRNRDETYVYDLKVSTEFHLEGTENSAQIHFNRSTRI